MSGLDLTASLITFLVECIQLVLFFRAVCFSNDSLGASRRYILAGVLALASHTVKTCLQLNTFAGMLYSGAVDLLLAELLYRGRLRTKAVYLFAFYMVLAASDTASIALFAYWGGYEYEMLNSNSFLEIGVIVLARAISMTLILSFSRTKPLKGMEIKVVTALGMVLHALLGIYVLFHGLMTSWEQGELRQLQYLIYLCLLLVALNWLSITKGYLAEQAVRMKEGYGQLLRAQEKRLDELEQAFQSIRKLHHDFKHHIAVTSGLLLQGQFREAAGYLFQLRGRWGSAMPKAITGNHIIDAILMDGEKRCLDYGIRFAVKGGLPQRLLMDPVDLGSVVGNILNNAVHAAVRIPDPDKRWIQLSFRFRHGRLAIRLTNSMAQGNEKQEEGLGIPIIREIVERYEGRIDLIQDDNLHSTCIILTNTDNRGQ